MRPRTTLAADVISRCERYGDGVVDAYRSGKNNASRAFSWRGTDENPEIQSRSKMAEAAFTQIVGLPLDAVKWDAGIADKGWDVIHLGWKIDVKTTWLTGRYLCWDREKNSIFESKDFDILALVRGNPPVFEWTGWITKADFRRQHLTAGSPHKLIAGTWYVDVAKLALPAALRLRDDIPTE